MNKVFSTLALMLCVCSLRAAVPEIVSGSVSLSKSISNDVVEISYMLTGEPAVVTIDIQTNTVQDASGNWVSIGGEGIGLLGGEEGLDLGLAGEVKTADIRRKTDQLTQLCVGA